MTVPSYYQNHLTPQQIAHPPPPPPSSFMPAQFAPAQPIQVMKFSPPGQAMQPQPQQPPPMFAQFSQPRPLPVAPQVVQPVPMQQALPPMSPNPHRVKDWYGRVQDPLHFALFQPPPFRPQMDGETFAERVAKNIMLDIGTMVFFHFALALRQMALPPSPLTPQPERVVGAK